MALVSKNPYTEEVIKEYPELTAEELKSKIDKAEQAFLTWKDSDIETRKKLLLKLAEVLKSKKNELAEIMTKEMGKTIVGGIGEIEKCALNCEYYAENLEKFLSPEKVETEAQESYVRFDPIGVVLAVMPWNFPFWQVMRFIPPAIGAGNTAVLKHASNVQGCAEALEQVMIEAGFPEGVFQNLAIGSDKVEAVIKNPIIKAVTLTGSEYAGTQVASTAASEVKKAVLELGGSDAFIVFDNVELDEVCTIAVKARCQNNGETCVAAKRFIVVKSIYEKFKELYKQKMEAIVVGDPMDEKTVLGPLVNEKSVEEIHGQVVKSVEMGAELVTGGEKIEGKGYFYKPTLLANVKPGMPAYDEEIFGPVAALILAEDEDDAVRIANDSRFGLGSSLWTKDIEKAKKYVPMLESGFVSVNQMVKSDPRLPFGGNKKSGFGRELSYYGLREFVNIKTVWIQ